MEKVKFFKWLKKKDTDSATIWCNLSWYDMYSDEGRIYATIWTQETWHVSLPHLQAMGVYCTWRKVTKVIMKSCCMLAHKTGSWDRKNNAQVTMNNDFWVMSEEICQWFSRVTKSRVKIIGKSHHKWHKNHYSQKRMYHFISYMPFYVLEHTILLKQSSIAHLATVAKDGLFWLTIVTSPQLICDVTRTRDTSIVTSYSSIVLARANWHKGGLH